MAKLIGLNPHSGELLAAIRSMGIEPNDCTKVIIEIGVDAPVIVHVQGFTDARLLGVVKALDGDIRVERGEASAEVAE
jgi:hypothetical protein